MLPMARCVLVLALAGFAAALAAEPAQTLRTGDPLPALAFDDQFEQSHRLGDCGALILFAPDRPSSDVVNEVLAGTDAAMMQARGLCYVADISAMPAIVTRMFALPAMRDYGYPVLLGNDADATAALPRQGEAVTLIPVDEGRAGAIEFAPSVEAVRQAIATHAPEPGGQ